MNFSYEVLCLAYQDGESGWSSLHRALHFGHLAVASILLQSGASITLEDTKSRTPIDLLSGPDLQVSEKNNSGGCGDISISVTLDVLLKVDRLTFFVFCMFFSPFSCYGGFQLGQWCKLSTRDWKCAHSKVTL